MNELVFKGEEGQALTNSLLLAEKFGKGHADVMRAARNLTLQNCAVKNMFVESCYLDSRNKEQPMFVMNRDGFTLLAMGFTGEKALQFKLEYIAAFNQMEKTLKSETNRNLSEAEILVRSAQLLAAQEQRMKKMEGELTEIKQRTITDLKHSTVVAYVSRHNIHLDVKRYSAIGTKASNMCKKRGIETSKVNDVRWGQVRVYPDEILQEVFAAEKANAESKKEKQL